MDLDVILHGDVEEAVEFIGVHALGVEILGGSRCPERLACRAILRLSSAANSVMVSRFTTCGAS